MVVPEPLVRPIERLQQNLSISVPTLSQIAAEAAFEGRAEMEAIKRGYQVNRRILIEGLPQAGLDRFLPADGAFYLYADVSKFTSDSLAFAGEMLEKASVAATPGVDFDPVHGHQFIRFSYAGSADEMREAVARIAKWLGLRRGRFGWPARRRLLDRRAISKSRPVLPGGFSVSKPFRKSLCVRPCGLFAAAEASRPPTGLAWLGVSRGLCRGLGRGWCRRLRLAGRDGGGCFRLRGRQEAHLLADGRTASRGGSFGLLGGFRFAGCARRLRLSRSDSLRLRRHLLWCHRFGSNIERSPFG